MSAVPIVATEQARSVRLDPKREVVVSLRSAAPDNQAGLDLVHHAAMCLTCIVDGAEGRKRARYALRDALRELDRQGGGAKP